MGAMIDVVRAEGVVVLRMAGGENRLNGPFVRELAAALDEAADPGGPLVLVGTGKFFCNGLDLDWLGTVPPAEAGGMFRDLHGVLARLLRFPGATVAAVNGHAFGAGAVLAAAADYRIQRADRGYVCFPEVDLSLPMSDEFDAVLRAKLPAGAVLDALLTGRRYDGAAARRAGLVDAVTSEDLLVDTAVDRLRDHAGKAPAAVAALKEQQHKHALVVLDAGS